MVVIFHTLYFYRTLKMRSTHGNWCEMFSYTTCHNFIYGISGAHSPSLHCWHGNASIYTEKCLKREKLRKDILSLIFVKDIHLEAPTNDWWFFFFTKNTYTYIWTLYHLVSHRTTYRKRWSYVEEAATNIRLYKLIFGAVSVSCQIKPFEMFLFM